MVIPDEGDIIFDNTSIKNDINYRNQIGYMPQIGRYPENMSIGQVWSLSKELDHINPTMTWSFLISMK
jgi:Cu-processing system ATP-binding protein